MPPLPPARFAASGNFSEEACHDVCFIRLTGEAAGQARNIYQRVRKRIQLRLLRFSLYVAWLSLFR